MSRRVLDRIVRQAGWVALAAVAVGIAAVATGLGAGARSRTVGELIASWLFFAGIAAGAAAFRAFFRIVDARWARPLGVLGGIQVGFAPVAALVLVVVLASARSAPWVANATGWFGTRALVARELAANGVLFGLAYLWFRRRPGRPDAPRARAVAYCLVYAVVLSLWAFDFVLGPDPTWESTLVGPYVFTTAFIAGTGVVMLHGLAVGALGERERRDAAILVLALAIFWFYLFWSQVLTTWYANLPEEIGFALRRAVDGWGWVVIAVVALVFVAPFVGLIHPAGRRSSRLLGAVLVAQLAGLWLDFHLLVVPSLSAPGSAPLVPRDALIAVGMLGAFVLSVSPAVRRELALGREDSAQERGGANGREVQRA